MLQADIQEKLEKHKQWLRTDGKEGNRLEAINADLIGADLIGANLSGVGATKI